MREIRPPFGAEEFLDDGSGTLPVDIKVYTFYGEAPVARLRRVLEHGPGGAGAHRVVDRNGTDFDTYRGQPTDPTIPLPGALADLFDVAERVSIVIRAAFSRIDLYDIRGRIVFGEVTPCPGSSGGVRTRARRHDGRRVGAGAGPALARHRQWCVARGRVGSTGCSGRVDIGDRSASTRTSHRKGR
jgi:hypothetical protein